MSALEDRRVTPRRIAAPLILLFACALAVKVVAAEETSEAKTAEAAVVQKGSKVALEYTLSLADGTKVESNTGGEALEYEHGAGQIIPGLEEKLAGLKPGDTRQIKVPADKAYGPVQSEAFQEVEITKIPEDARRTGAELSARDPNGMQHQVRIHEVKKETAVVDFNHPLAGKDLTFDVKVLSIK